MQQSLCEFACMHTTAAADGFQLRLVLRCMKGAVVARMAVFQEQDSTHAIHDIQALSNNVEAAALRPISGACMLHIPPLTWPAL
jgi:hypothetical protein